MKRCSHILASGRRCVRKSFDIKCYQHQVPSKPTELEDIEDYQLLDILSYNFPNIKREDFHNIFNSLSDSKRKYFLKALDLDPKMSLNAIDKTFYFKDIPLDTYPEEGEDEEDDNPQDIRIDSEDLDMVKNLDEIVLPRRNEISILFDYPLHIPYIKKFYTDNPLGFTRRELIKNIQQTYEEIYDESQEAHDMGEEDPYGVWSHGIEDLSLMEISQEDNILKLSIDS